MVSITVAAQKDKSTQLIATELRLAHFSVMEYLISDRLENSSMHRYHISLLCANVSTAKTCLPYLLYFESPTILMAKFDLEFPLFRYAAEFWPRRYRSITDDVDREVVDCLGYDLVKTKNFGFNNWLRVSSFVRPQGGITDRLRLVGIGSPLYLVSLLGVTGVLKMVEKGANVNAEREIFTAMSTALSGRQEGAIGFFG